MENCYRNMDTKTKFCCGSLTALALTSVILMACSFSSVEPTEYGILYSSLHKTVDHVNVQESGLQFVGPFTKIIKFPRTHKVIEFSDYRGADEGPLATRTAEGLELHLHVSFQYQLVKEEIPQLYALAGSDFPALFQRIAADVILQQAGNYPAPDYWKNRTKISHELEIHLRNALLHAHANCTGLMLLKIDMPDVYEGAIVNTQVVIQETTTQKKIMNSTLIRQEIEILRSEAHREIAVINARADSQATYFSNNARAWILNNTITKQSEAYKNVKDSIGTTNSRELLDYIFYLNIMNLNKTSGNNKLLVGMQNTLVDLEGLSGKGY